MEKPKKVTIFAKWGIGVVSDNNRLSSTILHPGRFKKLIYRNFAKKRFKTKKSKTKVLHYRGQFLCWFLKCNCLYDECLKIDIFSYIYQGFFLTGRNFSIETDKSATNQSWKKTKNNTRNKISFIKPITFRTREIRQKRLSAVYIPSYFKNVESWLLDNVYSSGLWFVWHCISRTCQDNAWLLGKAHQTQSQ